MHGDIHINNIIINKEDYDYKYEFDKKLFYKSIKGKINYKIYLIDFGNSEFLLPEYRSQYIDDYYDDKLFNNHKVQLKFFFKKILIVRVKIKIKNFYFCSFQRENIARKLIHYHKIYMILSKHYFNY